MWKAIVQGAKAGLEAMSKVPVSGVIKAGVFIGVTVFTAWLLIRHTKKMHEVANGEDTENYSPVDDILSRNCCTDTDAYDDMDPEARRICKELNRSRKRRNKNKKIFKKKPEDTTKRRYRTVSFFDDEGKEDDDDPREVHFFDDADAMMDYDVRKKKHKKKKKIHLTDRAKQKARSIKDDIADWQVGGFSAEELKHKADEAARSLGFEVDSYIDDDKVDEETRRKCAVLF